MLVNKYRLGRFYKSSLPDGQFIYYPLHVPNDAALTIRSLEYLDQYAVLDYVARILPTGYDLVIKEHPALTGAVQHSRVRQLLCMHDNLRLLHPAVNNHDVMRAAAAIVTINSKSGAEALLLERPVVVLGDAFYSHCSLVRKADCLAELPGLLSEAVGARKGADGRAIRSYFQEVWEHSWPGELYDVDPENTREFSDSLAEYLNRVAWEA